MLHETEVKAAEDLTAALNNFNGLTQEVVEANKAALKEELDDLVLQGFDDAMGKVQSLIDKGKTEIQETATSGKQTITEDTANAQKVISTGKNEIQELITQGQEAISSDKQNSLDAINTAVTQGVQTINTTRDDAVNSVTTQGVTTKDNIVQQGVISLQKIAAQENTSKANIIAQENASVQAVTDIKDVSVATLTTTTQGYIDNLQSKYDGFQSQLNHTIDNLLEKDSPDGKNKIRNTNNAISFTTDDAPVTSTFHNENTDEKQVVTVEAIKSNLSISKEGSSTSNKKLAVISNNDFLNDNVIIKNSYNDPELQSLWDALYTSTKYTVNQTKDYYHYIVSHNNNDLILVSTNKKTGKTYKQYLGYSNYSGLEIFPIALSNPLRDIEGNENICVFLILSLKQIIVLNGTDIIDRYQCTDEEYKLDPIANIDDLHGECGFKAICAKTSFFFMTSYMVSNSSTKHLVFTLDPETKKVVTVKTITISSLGQASTFYGTFMASNGDYIYISNGYSGYNYGLKVFTSDGKCKTIQAFDEANNEILTSLSFNDNNSFNDCEKPVLVAASSATNTYFIELEGLTAKAYKFPRNDLNHGSEWVPLLTAGMLQTDNSWFVFCGTQNHSHNGERFASAAICQFYFKIDKTTKAITQLTYPWNNTSSIKVSPYHTIVDTYYDKYIIYCGRGAYNENLNPIYNKYIVLHKHTDEVVVKEIAELHRVLIDNRWDISYGASSFAVKLNNITSAVNSEGLALIYKNRYNGQTDNIIFLTDGNQMVSYDITKLVPQIQHNAHRAMANCKVEAFGRNFMISDLDANQIIISPKKKLADGAPSLEKPDIFISPSYACNTNIYHCNQMYDNIAFIDYKTFYKRFKSSDNDILFMPLFKEIYSYGLTYSMPNTLNGTTYYKVISDTSSKTYLKWQDEVVSEVF